MGLGQKISSSLVWVWKISPKIPIFSIFCPLGQKNLFGSAQKVQARSAPYLLWVKSMLGLGRVRYNLCYLPFAPEHSRPKITPKSSNGLGWVGSGQVSLGLKNFSLKSLRVKKNLTG